MASYPTTARSDENSRFPDLSADDTLIRDYRRRYFAERATFRSRHMQRFVRNLYYDLGWQWIELDVNQLIDGARGFAWREQQSADLNQQQIQPVTNMVASSIDVEFATLSKRQWQPKVVTMSRDPRAEATAKVKDDILQDRLKRLYWDDLRDEFIRGVITLGTYSLHSWWDESFAQTTWVSSPTAAQCSSCGAMLSSPEVPATLSGVISEGVAMRDGSSGNLWLEGCPMCGGPLQPTALDEGQSRGNDVLGRPLGAEYAKGATNLELVSPFEYYPQNGGVESSPMAARIHGISKIRSLDWIEEHWPAVVGKVERESPEVLFRQHPLLGSWDIVGRLQPTLDGGIYDSHARVFTLYADPCFRFPEGRAITIVGGTQELVVENGVLQRSVTDQRGNTLSCPKGMVATANWKSRAGEFWGKGLPDDLISPQNRINALDAQTIEARERMGSPNLMVPEGADLQGPEFRAGYGVGRVFTYTSSPLHPNEKPEPFGSILMPAGVNVERQNSLEDITRIIGPADIEIGNAPRNITTTSGLQILGEQAERRRGTRERSITSAFQRVWKHQLDLLSVFRVEPDTYEAQTPDGVWEIRQYDRDLLVGENKIDIEKQAYIEKSILQREATREALVDGLYVIDSPLARKKLLDRMGLPADINEDSNLQIDHAKRDWVDFVDSGRVPVIDTTLDDPAIRFQTFGVMLKQDEGRRIAEAAGWPQILPLITGWEKDLAQANALFEQVEATYGPSADPQQAAEQYAQLTANYQQQKAAYEAAVAAGASPMPDPQTGEAGLPPQPMPPVPPIPVPRGLQERILMVWMKLLQPRLQEIVIGLAQQDLSMPEQVQERVMNFLRFRAVVEAYRMMTMSMQQGAAPPGPAPGSGATMIPGDKGSPGMEMPPQPQGQEPPQPGNQPKEK